MAGLGGLGIFAPITVSNGGISVDTSYAAYFGDIRGAGNVVITNGITCDDVGAGGGFTDGTYIGGGSSGASINNNGRIVRTSTIDMKKNLEEMTTEEAKSVLGLVSYTGQYKKDKHDVFEDQRRYPFFVAEQGAKAGAELWVARQHDVTRDKKTGAVKKITRNQQGKPIGFRTGDITIAHNMLIKELFKEVENLKQQVAELKAA
jgi:hypothetical protein